jgi:hypothetical protein
MALPFLHTFRARSAATPPAARRLDQRTWEWPLSLVGARGPDLLTFRILGLGETAPRSPGLFIYARRTPAGEWQALFIGEAANLRNRLAFNEIAADALLSGATDIHVLETTGDAAARRDMCERLVFTIRPRLNQDPADRNEGAARAGASRRTTTGRKPGAA